MSAFSSGFWHRVAEFAMLYDLQHKATQGARRAALGAVSVALIGVGTGFLTVAAWLVLSALRDAQFAALVIGLTYLGAGIIALFIGPRPGPPPCTDSAPRPTPTTPVENVAVAFLQGFRTGKELGR